MLAPSFFTTSLGRSFVNSEFCRKRLSCSQDAVVIVSELKPVFKLLSFTQSSDTSTGLIDPVFAQLQGLGVRKTRSASGGFFGLQQRSGPDRRPSVPTARDGRSGRATKQSTEPSRENRLDSIPNSDYTARPARRRSREAPKSQSKVCL